MRRLHVSICLFTIVLAAGSTCFAAEKSNLRVKVSTFGKTPDGRTIELYTLTNTKGVQVAITNYGGRVVSLWAPDSNGKMGDVVLGFDDLNGYLGKNPYFGALIGRYENRIGDAKFTLNGVEYKLPQNDGKNSLHGGTEGFDRRVWTAREVRGLYPGLELTFLSRDGEEGYPGNLDGLIFCSAAMRQATSPLSTALEFRY